MGDGPQILGPGAFVTVADEKTGFADAILNKMVREVAGGPRQHTAGLPVSGQ